uniref:Macrophage erythroblast attacher n=1 Tax=Ananas comosus var. bracteatus TaxID=296719 RepID=A0A6V7Q9V5_ANACO|nr:unnamed protein product [Ananas comosus var. bracteatus]
MEIDSPPPTANGDTAVAPPAAASATATATAVPASARMARVAESLKLEQQFARVPVEHFRKTIRANQRCTEKEVSAVLSGVEGASVDDSMSREDAVTHLTSLVSRLQGLKRKLEEGGRTENLQEQRCRARLDHLGAAATAQDVSDWSNTRLKRILVDYMLRMSFYNTAKNIAESNNIQELVDLDAFLDAKRVIDSLQNKEVALALAWCAENKSRLKKSKSNFEFQLRLQEFIELVRTSNYLRAIAYARKFLAPWGVTHMKELQHFTATLAFKSTTSCPKYKVLFESRQWDNLVEQFKQEFCRLFGMTLQPLLNIYLQAGLLALKTPSCYEDKCPREDPLSQEGLRKLAEPLPFSKQNHSKLVCYITKEPMDTENPPLVLPNGYVYGTKALEEMAHKNEGKITCPRTCEVYKFSDLIKAYIS